MTAREELDKIKQLWALMTDEELAEIEAEADEYVDDEDDSDDIELDEEISDEEIVDENYILFI